MMIIAALLASAPVTTIIVDLRNSCGDGRIAARAQELARRAGREEARKAKAEGKEVRMIVLQPGMQVGGEPGPVVMIPTCTGPAN